MNYFALPSAAERNADGRPYTHLFVNRMKQVSAPSGGRLARALDVGCGTGRSTLALLDLADEVVSADISAVMLAHAPRDPRITYVESQAETIPFPRRASTSLPLGWPITGSTSRDSSPRLIASFVPRVWLAIYTDRFLGEMVDNPAFKRWHSQEYLRRYPAPQRSPLTLADDEARRLGFDLVKSNRFISELTLTAEELAANLISHSNIIAVVEGGTEDLEAVGDWLLTSLQPLFRAETAIFRIQCARDIFHRQAETA